PERTHAKVRERGPQVATHGSLAGAATLGSRGAADCLDGITLDDVAFEDVGGFHEPDAAPEAGLDLADVVLEPAERVDLVRGDDLAAAPQAHAAGANDATVGDVRAGDHLAPDLDQLADLGAALDDLDLLRLEETTERLLDVVGELVDDVVEADVDLLGLRGATRGVADRRVEADDDRVRCRREQDVVVADLARALVQDVELDFVALELAQGVGDGAERSRHVRLEDDPKLLGLPGLDLAVEVLEGRAA